MNALNFVSTAAEAAALSSGNLFVRSLAVFISSLLPFIENKGAIILAAALKLKWYLSYLLTCIGSYLPVPFLLRMKKHPLGKKETSPKLLQKAHQALEKHEAQLKKYGPPALFVVVCIPLTGVGCWIGSTLARLTDMDEKRAGLAILGGTLVSGLITILGVYGLIGGIQDYNSQLVLTQGGPGYTTYVPGYYMYIKAFGASRMGYASAVGVVMFVVIFGLTILIMRYKKKEEV